MQSKFPLQDIFGVKYMDGRKDGHNHTFTYTLWIVRRDCIKTVMLDTAFQKSENLRFIYQNIQQFSVIQWDTSDSSQDMGKLTYEISGSIKCFKFTE
jgi:hypothetical protein